MRSQTAGKGKGTGGFFGKPVVVVAMLAVIAVTAAFLYWRHGNLAVASVAIGDDVTVVAELAETPMAWERGLSGKPPLERNEGMLFRFPSRSRYAFWMKGMRFPIDIIWIVEGEIADITVDVPVPDDDGPRRRYFPRMPVDTVLEVPAGFAAAHGLRTGMPVRIEVDRGNGVR